MSFRQKLKQNLKPGNTVTLIKDGLEYTGKVVDIDFMNPADSSVVLVDSEEKITVMSLTTDVVIIADGAVNEKQQVKLPHEPKVDDELDEEIDEPVRQKGKKGKRK